MKHLDEYIQEQLAINEEEGKFKEWFKGFWNWLLGGNRKPDKYDPTSDYYDPKEKVRYINKFSSDNVTAKIVENKNVLSTIITQSLNKEDAKDGFFKIKEWFKKFPAQKDVNDRTKWISFIFKSEQLTDCCALIGITKDDEECKEKNVVFITEFLSIYKYVINFGDVVKALKDFDPDIIIKDPYLISQLKKEELPIIEVSGKKGYYTLG